MLLYYLKCRKNTASKKPKLVKTKNARIMGASNCVLCSSKRYKTNEIKNKYLIAGGKFMPKMYLIQPGF